MRLAETKYEMGLNEYIIYYIEHIPKRVKMFVDWLLIYLWLYGCDHILGFLEMSLYRLIFKDVWLDDAGWFLGLFSCLTFVHFDRIICTSESLRKLCWHLWKPLFLSLCSSIIQIFEDLVHRNRLRKDPSDVNGMSPKMMRASIVVYICIIIYGPLKYQWGYLFL